MFALSFWRINLLMHIIAHNCTLSFISNYEQKKIMQNFLLKLHIMLKYNLYTLNYVLIYMQHKQYIIFLWLYIYIIFIRFIIFVIIYDLPKCEIISDMILIWKKHVLTERKRQLMNYQFHCIFRIMSFAPGLSKNKPRGYMVS